jgi:uncharacterized protein (DUF1684 family)
MKHRLRAEGRGARLALTGLVVLVGSLFGCTSGPPPPADTRPVEERILSERRTKDEYFRTAADSPIPRSQRAAFTGLSYFPVDSAYRVPATLLEDQFTSQVIYQLKTSTSRMREMRKVGSLTFTLSGTQYMLTAFAEEGGLARLFVPFGDLTNGAETYGGGRYLDLDRNATGLYDLDFNRAYHPYCVYDVTFDCPYPPSENRLPVAIRAGERLASQP